MDRKTFKLPFRDQYAPRWVCPTCKKGVLRIKKDSFHKSELADSKKARSDESWDPFWISYVYSCLFVCSNNVCKETVVNSGTGFVDVDYAMIPNVSWIKKVVEISGCYTPNCAILYQAFQRYRRIV